MVFNIHPWFDLGDWHFFEDDALHLLFVIVLVAHEVVLLNKGRVDAA